MRMHRDQVDVTVADARKLLRDHAPELADRPVRPVDSGGTVSAVFRVGDDLALRIPLKPFGGELREPHVLAVLAPHLPVAVPQPYAHDAERGWTIQQWLPGTTPSSDGRGGRALADDLIAVLEALRRVPTAGAGAAPRSRWPDAEVQAAITAAADELDPATTRAVWERLSAAAPWRRPPVWVHGDLLPGNLLVRGGRLVGLIDFDLAGVGDPACDLMVVWHVLGPASRAHVRRRLRLDDDTWHRGAAWALAQALIALPYYRHTNPTMAASARHAIRTVLDR
jgi:aminoglycoside phosphotransferase (APT) family kinase protein